MPNRGHFDKLNDHALISFNETRVSRPTPPNALNRYVILAMGAEGVGPEPIPEPLS